MAGTTDHVYLSLDEIIALNREKNIRSGSVKSFGSNRSNRSNYSHKSNYSHRSRGSRGRGSYHNGTTYNGQRFNGGPVTFRNPGRGQRTFHYKPRINQNYRTFGRTRPNSWYNGRSNVIANQIAKSRVKNAVRVLNKMPNQNGIRYNPYRAIRRQTMRRQIGNMDDIDNSGPISISVKNEHALKGLSIQRLAQFNQSNVSPLRRLGVGVSSNLSKQNDYRKKWGPRLDAKVQQTIADEFAFYESVPIPEDDLNDLKCPIKTTCLTLNDRFGSYLPDSD